MQTAPDEGAAGGAEAIDEAAGAAGAERPGRPGTEAAGAAGTGSGGRSGLLARIGLVRARVFPARASGDAERSAVHPAVARRRANWQRLPGWLFAGVTVLPALLVMAWLLAGLPLLLAGRFTDIPMIVISVPLAVALVFLGLRQVPSAWPHGIRDIWDSERLGLAGSHAAEASATDQRPIQPESGQWFTRPAPGSPGPATASRARAR